MKIQVVSVGHKMPGWVTEAWQAYCLRMPREIRIELTEIAPPKQKDNRKHREAELILNKIADSSFVVVLDEHGDQITTQKLSGHLQHWLASGLDITIIIGGADGLDESVKQHADLMLALSKLTLPHAMARVLLIEQLYRAMSILNNHPYHRE